MRFEFTRAQRKEINARAAGCCEDCKAKLKVGEGEYDHIIAQGYGGENTVENGQLLCRVCHKAKTGKDKGITERVKRIRDRHNGVMPKKSRPMPGSKASGLKKRMDGTVERQPFTIGA
jgi:5-methylcytosine-specific restriction endonuclease McrA